MSVEAATGRVVLFCKAPAAGRVKTRLCPPLRPEQAASLAEAFLLDELEILLAAPAWSVEVAYAPEDAAGWFRSRVPANTELWPQSGDDLGQRLSRALAGCEPERPMVILGADSPDLPIECVREAFRVLHAGAHGVLGPTPDGGYYLIGLRRPHPELFRNIPWSTDRVLRETMDRAHEAGVRLHVLEPWSDVDRIDDLRQLRRRLATVPLEVAPRTRACMAVLGEF